MSVKIMGMVWDLDNTIVDREEKYILLAYADHADHKGYNIFPAISTIMQKTGYKERAAQMITKSLTAKGFLVADGKGPKGTNKWRIPLDKDEVRIAPAKNAPPQNEVDWGANGRGEGVHQDAPEPSETPEPLDIELIKQKDICLEILQDLGYSVFGNNMTTWWNFRRRLEDEKVTISGDKQQMTIAGLCRKVDSQFSEAEVWQDKYAPYFAKLGLLIRFQE